MIRKFIIGYILLSISVITAQLFSADSIENILKPLLMVSLFAGYFSFRKEAFKQDDYFYLAAIVFSFLGDTFLMPLFNHFLAGLASFLIAHIFYIALFLKSRSKPIKLNSTQSVLLSLSLLFYLLLPSLILWKIIPQNPSYFLIIAILLYSTALFSLMLTAIIRKQSPLQTYQYILAGSGLFLLSDSFLAINKFVFSLPYSPLWVITTYTAAQALIFYGFLKRKI